MKNKTSTFIITVVFTTTSIWRWLRGDLTWAYLDIIIASIMLSTSFILSQMEGVNLVATSSNTRFKKERVLDNK